MLKITTLTQTSELTQLKLEGKLVEPWLVPFVEACRTAWGESREVHLELTDVIYLDTAGLSALSEMQKNGIVIDANSAFVEAMLRTRSVDS